MLRSAEGLVGSAGSRNLSYKRSSSKWTNRSERSEAHPPHPPPVLESSLKFGGGASFALARIPSLRAAPLHAPRPKRCVGTAPASTRWYAMVPDMMRLITEPNDSEVPSDVAKCMLFFPCTVLSS
jgi:hypothetical protein